MPARTPGQRIKQAIKAAGKTQQQVASHCGVSAQSVGNWVADRDEPKGTNLLALAEFLSLDASWILTGEEPVEQREVLEELREIRTAQEYAVEQMKQARDETMTALRELRQLIEDGTESPPPRPLIRDCPQKNPPLFRVTGCTDKARTGSRLDGRPFVRWNPLRLASLRPPDQPRLSTGLAC